MDTAVQDQTLRLPFLQPRRPRRSGVVVAGGIVGALAVGGLGLAALRADSRTVRSSADTTVTTGVTAGAVTTPTSVTSAPATTAAPSPAVTAAPTAATPTTAPPTTLARTAVSPTTAAPERLTPDSRLSVDGLGPVRIGMTLDEAAAAAGLTIKLRPEESGGLDCTYAHPVNGSDEMAFMVVAGRIVRIDIGRTGPVRVRTLSGIGRDSTEADVMRTYAGHIQVEPHPYISGAHNLVYVPDDAAYAKYRMIFEAVDGRITNFRSGLADPVSWTEGCS